MSSRLVPRLNVFEPGKVLSIILLVSWIFSVTATVTYDNKAIIINGRKRILISGSIHYPRSTPDMWPGLIAKAKEGGLDVIQTYVFWNGHEPEQGKYYFEDRFDLVRFIKLVQQAGLYVNLRIGPYACAEWNYGGFPVWLKHVPGIDFRTDNGPFKAAMQTFVEKIVSMMKAERLFEPQGGPIILSQVENEYELVEYYLGNPGKAYAKWAAGMAVGLQTGVPWIMCKEADAPDPVINTCNGFYCEGFWPNQKYKPKMWTEIWTAWLTNFGGPIPYRPVEDIAFAVARFVQNSGTFFNYYMYHGGTNFGRTSGGPFIATSYDYDAPLDEYGMAREPKWSHLKNLHIAIKKCETALLDSWPKVTSLGKNQEAHVFWPYPNTCAAFLANYDTQYSVDVTFNNLKYTLPPWSISILPDCKTVVFNTAQVAARQVIGQMLPAINWHFTWESYTEPVADTGFKNTFTEIGLKEQLWITWDKSDYLWYMADITINGDEGFLKTGKWPWLTVNSAGHALHVFLNGQLVGTAYGSADQPKFQYNGQLNLKAGVNKLSLLSISVGLQNIGLHFENWNVGILGPVTLSGLNSGTWDMSKWKWTYKIGVLGEDLSLFNFNSVNSVKWAAGNWVAKRTPLTWYKTTFDAPAGNDPLALDMNTMSKGQIWINGKSIGRHWPQYKASGKCGNCNYAGIYGEKKCLGGCGQPSQRWYHVPRSWLFPQRNLLVVFEEWGGDPSGITLVKRVQ